MEAFKNFGDAKQCRWTCTGCSESGGFSYYTEAFASRVLAAQQRGHRRRNPKCDGELRREE